MAKADQLVRSVNRTLLIESVVIMIIAAALYGVTYSFDDVPEILAQGIQPAVFPRVVLIIMFGLAALQAVRAVRLSPDDVAKLSPVKTIPSIVWLTAAFLIAFAAAMPIIGTFPALLLFLPALALLWGERRWHLIIASFLGFIAFAYVLFRLIMNVPLP